MRSAAASVSVTGDLSKRRRGAARAPVLAASAAREVYTITRAAQCTLCGHLLATYCRLLSGFAMLK